jgi:hypothetical protein
MPAAALLVHQLRFVLAFGGRTSAVLAQQGHAYLSSVVPWIACLFAVGVGAFLWALGRAFAGQRSAPRYAVSLVALWIASSACLVALYVAQEFLEGLLATGHPAGLAGIFGFGGWWAVPAALCVGLVLATLFHGARWVLDEVARQTQPRSRARRSPSLRVRPWRDAFCAPPAPLVGGWSGRGPPL